MQYEVVTEGTPLELEATVNKMLAEGWQLQGGVSISMAYRVSGRDGDFDSEGDFTLAQALVKPDAPNSEVVT